MKIKEINYGIAFQTTENNEPIIEVNKQLKEDKVLYDAVIQHELQHTLSNNKYMDFWLDLKPKWYSWRLFKWSLRHPKSLFCFSPFFVSKGEVFINPFVVIMLFVIIALVLFNLFMLKLLL